MADPPRTPVKIKEIGCFTCYDNTNRIYKVNGRKAVADNFSSKLNIILGSCLVDDLKEHDAGVCRNCYHKIVNCADFIVLMRNSANSYTSTVLRKRGASETPSPIRVNNCINVGLKFTQKLANAIF